MKWNMITIAILGCTGSGLGVKYEMENNISYSRVYTVGGYSFESGVGYFVEFFFRLTLFACTRFYFYELHFIL